MKIIKEIDIKDVAELCSCAETGEEIQIETKSGAKLMLCLASPGQRTRRIEQLAEALHDGWWEYNLTHGFRLGPRNRKRLTHPHMVPWASLNAESHRQDRFQANVLLKQWEGGATEVTPEDVHNAWMTWELQHGDPTHDHLKPFKDSHKDDPWEHKIQADKVNQFLGKWKREP